MASGGEPRIMGLTKRIVTCDEVERAVFPPFKVDFSRNSQSHSEDQDFACDSDSDSDDNEFGGVILPGVDDHSTSVHDFSDLSPRLRGMQRARHREMVRQAARRGAVFGFVINGIYAELKKGNVAEDRKKVIAVQNGRPVEPSFAKGDWGVKWLDDPS